MLAGTRDLTSADLRRREKPSTAVIVLSAGASPYLGKVLRAVLACHPSPDAVILVWSGREAAPQDLPQPVEVVRIAPESFDHGGTRRLALELYGSDVVAFLSDDAEPTGEGWLAHLTAPFSDPAVSAVYGRQVPRPDCGLAERAFRNARYPETSLTLDRTIFGRLPKVGLPISDANAAYRVSAVAAVGGFPKVCPYGEDLVVAHALMDAGWRVLYSSDAAAWHSHRLSSLELFLRGVRAGRLSGLVLRGRALPTKTGFGAGARFAVSILARGWDEAGAAGVISVLWASGLRVAGYLVGKSHLYQV